MKRCVSLTNTYQSVKATDRNNCSCFLRINESAQVLDNKALFLSIVITLFWWITWNLVRVLLSMDGTKHREL